MARTAKLPRPRAVKTRAETEEAVAALEKEVGEQEPGEASSLEHEAGRRAELLKSVESVTVESVTQRIAALSVDATRALGHVSEQLVEQVRELESVREAVAVEREEMSRLHKIDVAATAINVLVADYAAKRTQLQAEHDEQRTQWAQEDKLRDQQRKEAEEALKKARERETEEYEYKKSVERKKAQNTFDDQMQKQEKQNREKQEALDKSWLQREESLKEREAELADLRKLTAAFPVQMKKEVDSAVASAVDRLQRDNDTKVQLLTKDFESDRRVATLNVKAMEETLAKQHAQIADLQQQVQLAKQQVQDIAMKALDSAAGAKTLEEVRQIAREQAKREVR